MNPETQERADYVALLASIERDLADRDWLREQRRFAPWQIVFAGMTAGAAFFAAGVALAALLLR